MPRGAPIDLDAFTREYLARDLTLDEMCTKFRISKGRLVKVVRQLGLSRPKGTRPKPVPPGVIDDYRAGQLRVKDIAAKWSLSFRDVYAALRKAKLVTPGHGERGQFEWRIQQCSTCQVCGERFKRDLKKGAKFQGAVCGPDCLLYARMHPELGVKLKAHYLYPDSPETQRRVQARRRKIERMVLERCDVDMDAWNEAFETFGHVDVPWIPKWQPSKDRRAVKRREGGGTFFGDYADKSVLLRPRLEEGSEVFLEIRRSPDETSGEWITRVFLGGMADYAEVFDAVFVSRCSCPSMTEFVVERLEDLPDEPGDYGLCPQCGVVAVEVKCL